MAQEGLHSLGLDWSFHFEAPWSAEPCLPGTWKLQLPSCRASLFLLCFLFLAFAPHWIALPMPPLHFCLFSFLFFSLISVWLTISNPVGLLVSRNSTVRRLRSASWLSLVFLFICVLFFLLVFCFSLLPHFSTQNFHLLFLYPGLERYRKQDSKSSGITALRSKPITFWNDHFLLLNKSIPRYLFRQSTGKDIGMRTSTAELFTAAKRNWWLRKWWYIKMMNIMLSLTMCAWRPPDEVKTLIQVKWKKLDNDAYVKISMLLKMHSKEPTRNTPNCE